jgi:hypothetical protein
VTSYTGKEISSLRIGTVTAVRGRRIDITVDVDKNDSSLIFQGEIISNVSIGSFLVVRRGYAHLVVQVEEEELIESSAWENSDYQRDVDRNTRILKTILLGEFETDTSVSRFQTRFISGPQTSPLIGNIAYLASPEQASKIYVSTSEPGTQITIGRLASDSSIPISLDINSIFASHIGIFGNTGSGKSHSLCQLYTQLFESLNKIPSATQRLSSTRFILFDFTGEYSTDSTDSILCDDEFKSVYGISKNARWRGQPLNSPIPLNIEILDDTDFWVNILEADSSTQRHFVRKALSAPFDTCDIQMLARDFVHLYFRGAFNKQLNIDFLFSIIQNLHETAHEENETFRRKLHDLKASLKFDPNSQIYYIQTTRKKIYYTTHEFNTHIDDFFDRYFPQTPTTELTPLDTIRVKFNLTSLAFAYIELMKDTDLDSILQRLDDRIQTLLTWFEFTSNDIQHHRPLYVINLKDTHFDERQLIPLIITRAAYNEQKKLSKSQQSHLNIIIDEAHNILSLKKGFENNSLHDTRLKVFEEIILEGRKLNTFLTIISQRPADIAPSIASQLHHYFLHRLGSLDDLECVKNSVLFLNRNSFEAIPSLSCGTCIISGTSVRIPAIVKIDELPDGRRPDTATIDLVKLWGLASDSPKDAGGKAADSADSQDSESTAEES